MSKNVKCEDEYGAHSCEFQRGEVVPGEGGCGGMYGKSEIRMGVSEEVRKGTTTCHSSMIRSTYVASWISSRTRVGIQFMA